MTMLIINLCGTSTITVVNPTHVPSIGDQVAIHTPNTKVVEYREVRNVRYDYCDNDLTITAFV